MSQSVMTFCYFLSLLVSWGEWHLIISNLDWVKGLITLLVAIGDNVVLSSGYRKDRKLPFSIA